MIRVIIEREAARQPIRAFTVKGHAQFAKHGQDIVCAGVSAVTFGTVNAAERLLGVSLTVKTGEGGYLEARVPDGLPDDLQSRLQLLLESMLVMLETIEQSYGKYITIQDHS